MKKKIFRLTYYNLKYLFIFGFFIICFLACSNVKANTINLFELEENKEACIINDGITSYYNTLQDAVNNVKDNDIIIILKNIKRDSTNGIVYINDINFNKKFTIDLNGYEIENTHSDILIESCSCFYLKAPCELTIIDTKQTGKIISELGYGIYLNGLSNAIIDGGYFDCPICFYIRNTNLLISNGIYNGLVTVNSKNSTFIINGGFFNSKYLIYIEDNEIDYSSFEIIKGYFVDNMYIKTENSIEPYEITLDKLSINSNLFNNDSYDVNELNPYEVSHYILYLTDSVLFDIRDGFGIRFDVDLNNPANNGCDEFKNLGYAFIGWSEFIDNISYNNEYSYIIPRDKGSGDKLKYDLTDFKKGHTYYAVWKKNNLNVITSCLDLEEDSIYCDGFTYSFDSSSNIGMLNLNGIYYNPIEYDNDIRNIYNYIVFEKNTYINISGNNQIGYYNQNTDEYFLKYGFEFGENKIINILGNGNLTLNVIDTAFYGNYFNTTLNFDNTFTGNIYINSQGTLNGGLLNASNVNLKGGNYYFNYVDGSAIKANQIEILNSNVEFNCYMNLFDTPSNQNINIGNDNNIASLVNIKAGQNIIYRGDEIKNTNDSISICNSIKPCKIMFVIEKDPTYDNLCFELNDNNYTYEWFKTENYLDELVYNENTNELHTDIGGLYYCIAYNKMNSDIIVKSNKVYVGRFNISEDINNDYNYKKNDNNLTFDISGNLFNIDIRNDVIVKIDDIQIYSVQNVLYSDMIYTSKVVINSKEMNCGIHKLSIIYDKICKNYNFEILKINPNITIPTNVSCECYSNLTEIELPSGFIFEENTYKSLNNIGNYVLKCKYIPDDIINYNIIEHIDIVINVVKNMHNIITNLSIDDWVYDESPSVPIATCNYGEIIFSYSNTYDGIYESDIPYLTGKYYIKAVVMDDLNHNGCNAIKEFEIHRAVVEKPETSDINYIYNGEIIKYNIKEDNRYIIINSEHKNSGLYIVSVSLKNDNYCWNDGSQDVLNYNFIINKCKVKIPQENTKKFIYNRNVQTYELEESNIYNISNNKMLNVGRQIVYVTLSDKDNYVWEDGNSEDLTYLFVIDKAHYDIKNIEFNDTTYLYDGIQKELKINGVLPEDLNCRYIDNKLTEPGFIKATCKFIIDELNYYPLNDLEATLTIKNPQIIDNNNNISIELIVTDSTNLNPNFNSLSEINIKANILSRSNKDKVKIKNRILPRKLRLHGKEQAYAIYDIKLYQIIDGKEIELDSNDIKEGTKVSVKIYLPNKLKYSKITRIIHIHNSNDIKEIEFDSNKIINNYYTFECDNLSQFILVTNTKVNVFGIILVTILIIDLILVILYILWKFSIIKFSNKITDSIDSTGVLVCSFVYHKIFKKEDDKLFTMIGQKVIEKEEIIDIDEDNNDLQNKNS